MGEEEDEEWRHLCDLAGKESDPQRLRKLLDQLIERPDARRKRKPSPGSSGGNK
jgi:hypothetical protein